MAHDIASPIRVFYTDNDTDSLADALKAAGVAEALRSWLRALGMAATPIIIEDKGAYHQITLPVGLDEAAVERIAGGFAVGGAQLLVNKSQQENAAEAGLTLYGFDYETYRENRDAYFKAFLAHSKVEREIIKASAAYEQIQAFKPPLELPVYVSISHFKIAPGYNALVEQWKGATAPVARANARFLLRAFAVTPNPIDAAGEAWEVETARAGGKASVTRLQIVNPTSGKGANAPKANTTIRADGLDGFWLIEYLKFVGLFTLGAPVVVKKSKDRKTFVLRPVKVELGALDSIMHSFRDGLSGNTAVKVDVVTALRFTKALVTYLCDALKAGEPDPWLAMFGEAGKKRQVTNIARGFDVAFFKNMGSAFATMNLATVNLPEWLDEGTPLATLEQAQAALALIEEHLRVIGGIRMGKGEEGSDEYELLRRYREFFSGREREAFLDFAARYGDYVLSKLHGKQWVGQFTTEGLDFLMTQEPKKKYSPIIESEGFRAVAAAIRNATVRAQYTSARERSYPYEVRYGLGQELLRSAAYPHQFLATLGAFAQSYNAENARIDERITKGSLKAYRRASVRTNDLDEIVRLIDQYDGDSELICKMLLAYGYARDSRAAGDKSGDDGEPANGEDMEESEEE